MPSRKFFEKVISGNMSGRSKLHLKKIPSEEKILKDKIAKKRYRKAFRKPKTMISN